MEKTIYKILPTLKCNARCGYCYEKGCEQISMTDEIALRCAEFIKETAKGNIYFVWYGGEPLVGKSAISIICRECENNNLNFSSSVTTNGSLLNRNMLEEAIVIWNLNAAMITIDAVNDKYNSIKNYTNKVFNFNTVIDNIINCLKKDILIDIRINFAANNISNAKEVIEFFAVNFGNSVQMHCKPLIIDNCSIFDDFEGKNPYQEILEYQIEKGYPIIQEKLMLRKSIGNCPRIHSDNFLEIDPRGNIYNCEKKLFAGIKKGTIYHCESPFYIDCKQSFDYDECADCKLKIYCGGGCKFGVMQDKKNCISIKPIEDYIIKECRIK